MYYDDYDRDSNCPRVLKSIKRYCIDYPLTVTAYSVIVVGIYTRMIYRDIKANRK